MKRFLGMPGAAPSLARPRHGHQHEPIDVDAEEEEDEGGAPPAKRSVQNTVSSPPPDTGRPLTLADRMRPTSLDHYVGQSELLAEGALVRRLLDGQTLPSMIFWGPPGTGKTTLANIIAHRTKCEFVKLSAASCGLQQLKAAMAKAAEMQKKYKQHTILFIDEIHRFNKLQQDSLLGPVEDGTVTLIGATTENPSFECNHALLSRCRVLVLKKLEPADLKRVLQRGVSVLKEMHPSRASLDVTDEALATLAGMCDGDARVALNALEMSVVGAPSGAATVSGEDVALAFQRSSFHYDKGGEQHYNIISAMHKAVRGSDPDGALYWVARMLEGGEDPMYVARRLVRAAAEDIGLADPQALVLASAAAQATHLIGVPECNVVLGQLAVYLALAPKSIAVYRAYGRAAECVREKPLYPVPLHICNAPTGLMRGLGYGKGYKYNPDFDEPVDQTYLPAELLGERFYRPEEEPTRPPRPPAPPAAAASDAQPSAPAAKAAAPKAARASGWQC